MRDDFGVVRDGRFDVVGILPAFLLAVRIGEAFGSVQEAIFRAVSLGRLGLNGAMHSSSVLSRSILL